jgi:hypothetical protein
MGQLSLAKKISGMLPNEVNIETRNFIAYIKTNLIPDLWDEVVCIIAEDFENERASHSKYAIDGSVFIADVQEHLDKIRDKRPYKVCKQKALGYVYSN